MPNFSSQRTGLYSSINAPTNRISVAATRNQKYTSDLPIKHDLKESAGKDDGHPIEEYGYSIGKDPNRGLLIGVIVLGVVFTIATVVNIVRLGTDEPPSLFGRNRRVQ